MKVREVIRLVQDDGWVMIAQKGSHRQFKHPVKPGRVTVPGNEGKDVSPTLVEYVDVQIPVRKRQTA